MSDQVHVRLTDEERRLLLETAADALEFAVLRGGCMQTVPDRYPPPLQRHAAAFVSLHIRAELRGCIGSLEPTRALVTEVAENTSAAATCDHRFSPIGAEEIEDTEIEISILGPATALAAQSEGQVVSHVRPGLDGLILEAPEGRVTFLPSVWSQVAGAEEFVAALKQKAGWPQGFWSPEVRAYTYETEKIGPC